MAHCQAQMKDKIVHLKTAKEMWETLKKDCRPASNVSLATYTNRFYSYEPKKDATVDSISNELQDLQSAIFITKENKKLTELSKISALLQAVRKLYPKFSTCIEILEDKLDILDYEATVVALKETESRIRASGRVGNGNGYEEERAHAANDRKGRKRKWTGCYTCGDNHYQRECKEWLKTPEGREYKRQKGSRKPSASTGPLPTPGVDCPKAGQEHPKRPRRPKNHPKSDDEDEIEEEAHQVSDLYDEVPGDRCWGAFTEQHDQKEVTWVIDSACTRHMTYSREVFDEYVKLVKPRRVKVASGSYIYGIGLGNVTIRVFTDKLEAQELTLTDVLYVPQLAGSLISVPQLQSRRILTQTTESLRENAIILTKDG